jgi:hypothetical protein
MAGRITRRGPRPARRLTPRVEGLAARALLSAGGLGPPLGRFIAPGVLAPTAIARRIQPALHVDPHNAVNRQLDSGLLGPGFDRVALQVQLQGTPTANTLADRVLARPFVHSVLRDNDTYTLLNNLFYGSLPSATAAQQILPVPPTFEVQIRVPINQVSAQNPDGSYTVTIMPNDPVFPPDVIPAISGTFTVNLPSTNVYLFPAFGFADVYVPVGQIPSYGTANAASFQDVLLPAYASTGPALLSALRSGLSVGAPTALPTVPGLRLVNAFQQDPGLPRFAFAPFASSFRLAASGGLLNTLTAVQQSQVATGLGQFLNVLNNWTSASSAQLVQFAGSKPASQLLPPIPTTPLNGTVQVTLGSIQPPGTNAPERVDVGYIFDRAGDYGLVLSARGPLSTTVPNPPPNPVVAGDVQVEVSNAASLTQLSGWWPVEGVTEGSVLSGGLATTNQGGVTTFAASAGYGLGLEYGLGVQYTTVIPLGNVNALP